MKNTINQQELAEDIFANVLAEVPVAQLAELHSCSPQYVSQVADKYGIKYDRNNKTIKGPLMLLKELYWRRDEKEEA